jgi:hypothetical protein
MKTERGIGRLGQAVNCSRRGLMRENIQTVLIMGNQSVQILYVDDAFGTAEFQSLRD